MAKLPKIITDGWQNLLTGLGIAGKDKRTATKYGTPVILTHGVLNDLYRGDGFAKRIIDLPADEMTREWIKIEGDTDGKLLDEFNRLHTKRFSNRALKWAGLYGGSLVVMLIDDGGELDTALDIANMRKIVKLAAYGRYQCSVYKRYEDPEKLNYKLPEVYQVSTHRRAAFHVHETRVLRFNGAETPELILAQQDGWYDSELQSAYNSMRALGGVYDSVEVIISYFETGVLTINDLADKIAGGQEEQIRTRIELMNLSKSVINTMLLDTGESFEKKASQVRGLAELIDRYAEGLSAATGIPITLLMGRSPAGLQSSGKSDIRFWYDSIAADQEEKLYPQLMRLAEIIMLCKDGVFKGTPLPSWDITFLPLWQLTEKELADVRKIIGETDKIYIDSGVLQSEEVRDSRFGGDTYSIETSITPEED